MIHDELSDQGVVERIASRRDVDHERERAHERPPPHEPDDKDRCPDEPETQNGVDDGDGCPDVTSPKAVAPAPVVEKPGAGPARAKRHRRHR